jgi:hypothetical protein
MSNVRHERDGRARPWPIARIERFKEKERRTRKWINFAEIAEWCSKEDQSIVPSREKRAAAFDTLTTDLLAGEFDENGRSLVLYVYPGSAMSRMTRSSLQEVIENNYDGDHGRSAYLPHCWIARRLFDRWLARHRLPKSPRRFEPLGERPPTRLKKPSRGRPPEYKWSGVKSRLAGYATQHGPVQTWDELLQKCADFASELHPNRSTPSDKAIREAIERHQLDLAAGVARRK